MTVQKVNMWFKQPRILGSLKLAIIYSIFWLYCWKVLDPDFGWHLQAGNYIRQHWIPAHDIYSYTARTFPWIDHEWGSDVLVSLLYAAGGYGLLTTVFAGLWTAGLCLFRKRLVVSVLLIALLATTPYLAVRPTVWSLLGFAMILELGARGRTSQRARHLIPLVMLVWANLHGGFVIGLAAIVYYALLYRQKQWLVVFVASVLATFINPYGPHLYVEIARTVFDPALHKQITEWKSFNLGPKTWLFIGLWLASFILVVKRKTRSAFEVSPFLLIASLSSGRNMLLFIVAGLRTVDSAIAQTQLPRAIRHQATLVTGMFACLLASVLLINGLGGLNASTGREGMYPQQAVAYLQQHPCKGNLLNDYSYGGYLIWKLPATPVYIDGRMPSWRDQGAPESHMTRYYEILASPSALRSEVTKYNIRCALLSAESRAAIKELKNEGWKSKVRNRQSILLVNE